MSKLDEDFLKSIQNFNEDLQNYYNSNKFDENFVKKIGDEEYGAWFIQGTSKAELKKQFSNEEIEFLYYNAL